jgi:predicted NAD/FAD-binding protein
MRIAIVGAGVAGLTAAYALNRAHDIELFERSDYAGGHAHTVSVDTRDHPVGLDTGFIVYNEHTYPTFTKLLRDLNVGTKPGDMSISVRCRACDIEYSSRGLSGMLAQRRNALMPRRWRLALDIFRFYRDTRVTVQQSAYDGATLGEFLADRRYGDEFVRHFILPLASAVWSTPSSDVTAFPLRYFLRFLLNHGIIGLQPAFVWRTVEGGSQSYVRAMTATFPCRTRLSTPVRTIRRDVDGVELRFDGGISRRFDHVVLACHADEALALLGDASEDERRALGGFSYTTNAVTLHTDGTLLPERAAAQASWNYYTEDCRDASSPLAMTFHLNRLQKLDDLENYCVSLNATNVKPDTIIAEMMYEHPRYTFDTLAAQCAVERLQGARRTHFAGAYLGYGFHEDGVASGARVAAAFGVEL